MTAIRPYFWIFVVQLGLLAASCSEPRCPSGYVKIDMACKKNDAGDVITIDEVTGEENHDGGLDARIDASDVDLGTTPTTAVRPADAGSATRSRTNAEHRFRDAGMLQ
jgi:hypothetical protein